MNTAKRPNRRQVLVAGAALALAPGAVRAQAVDDFSKSLGVPVEIISADHQNKPDVGSAIARQWFDSDHVDVIMDLPNSAVALAVIAVAQEKDKAASCRPLRSPRSPPSSPGPTTRASAA